ncbi:MAG TPA: HEPN domain-containing protein [Candidatus Hydrogenedentes bacterium]|nr:HEPN domain-containing protein [Candidatus Hydrogenedentota bacterium]HPG69258.1 HEPN domain-containing protein [Candidatus Hydrogenedentota bacterium]
MQPEQCAEVRAWFEHAKEDLRAAEVDLSVVPPLVADALFHCQQAAEKALKGYLAAHDEAPRKTHDLAVLAGRCAQFDGTLDGVVFGVVKLTPGAWIFRYPSDVEPPEAGEAEEALVLAKDLC